MDDTTGFFTVFISEKLHPPPTARRLGCDNINEDRMQKIASQTRRTSPKAKISGKIGHNSMRGVSQTHSYLVTCNTNKLIDLGTDILLRPQLIRLTLPNKQFKAVNPVPTFQKYLYQILPLWSHDGSPLSHTGRRKKMKQNTTIHCGFDDVICPAAWRN